MVEAKLPPHDADLELAVLGSCISMTEVLATALDYIGKKNIFYVPKHQSIWTAIRSVVADERGVDLLTVTQKARALKFDDVSALDIVNCVNKTTSEQNVISHIFILIEYWVKRELQSMSAATLQLAFDEGTDALQLLHDTRIRIKDVEDSIGRAKISDIAKDTDRVVKDIITVAMSGRKPTGLVMTGFKELDELYGGANNGDFIVVGARPAMGKTSFALCWARNVAKSGSIAGVISIEMPTEQLVTRLLSIEAGLNNHRLQKEAHLMTKQEMDRLSAAGEKVSKMTLRIVDDPSVNVSKMRGIVKSFKELGAKIVLIDYLQIMRPEGKAQASNDTKFLDDLTRDLKQAAREFQIPIIALSQLSRSVEDSADKRPTLNHLRMSGQIEANADTVMFLYRPEYYKLEMPNDLGGGDSRGKGVVIIAKNRNGAVGDVVLDFVKETTEFRSVGFNDSYEKVANMPFGYPEQEEPPF